MSHTPRTMPKVKRIVWDLDGTLCRTKHDGNFVWWDYEHAEPIIEHIDKLRRQKQEGHYIFIWTSRPECDEVVTRKWLADHDVPFDGICFAKLRGDMYVDEIAVRPGELE